VLRTLGRQQATGNGAAETDGVVADVDVLLHLADALGLDLADLEGDQLAEIASLRTQRVADLTHQLATHRHRHGAELGLRLALAASTTLAYSASDGAFRTRAIGALVVGFTLNSSAPLPCHDAPSNTRLEVQHLTWMKK
jgi:hypothetical protein